MVGMSLMASASPVVLDMALAPVIAQKRAQNFATAETAAVTYAAQNEGSKLALTPVPSTCDRTEDVPGVAYTISCDAGEGQFRQVVERSFKVLPLAQGSTTYTNPARVFAFDTPSQYSHVECQPGDPWGVIWYNEHLAAGHLKACIPAPLWSQQRYDESNPDDWLYDISGYGFGQHKDY